MNKSLGNNKIEKEIGGKYYTSMVPLLLIFYAGNSVCCFCLEIISFDAGGGVNIFKSGRVVRR